MRCKCNRLPTMSLDRTDLSLVLQRTALFSTLTPEEIHLLAARALKRQFTKGELLFSEGELCHGLHVIASGKVRIFKTSLGGREQILAVNVSGETVAELPVFDGGPYPASAVAIDEVEIIFISQQIFQSFCMECPQVALKVLAVVGSRLRRLVGIIEELSFTTIRERLISALLRMAESQGVSTSRGIEFQLPGSHQELASQLGTVRELVSRNLMRLQAEGLLEVDARQIVVKNLKGLRASLHQASA